MDLTVTDLRSATLDDLQACGLAAKEELDGRPGWNLIPTSAAQVAQLLHWAQETNHPIAMNPKDAALLNQPVCMDLSGLSQVRKHNVDDFTIQVETGLAFGKLATLLAKHKQEFPLSYPEQATLADIVAEDRPALESGLRGLPRDYVLKAEIATPDGQVTTSGADVVKNATGYDLQKLYTGAHHTLGVVTCVTLKLSTLPPSRERWIYTLDSANATYQLAHKLLASNLPLRVCELSREDKTWKILIEIAGDSLLLQECATVLTGLSNREPRLLGPQGKKTLQSLQSGPTDATVIEAALPLGQWPTFVDQVLHGSLFKDVRIQIRPAAGLVYLIVENIKREHIEILSAEAANYDGFIQVVKAPDMGTLAHFNLPGNPAVQSLLKMLKKSYDPKGILYCPRLPI